MAIVTGVDADGVEALYDVPDDLLATYKLTAAPFTEAVQAQLFPSQPTVTNADADGSVPVAPAAAGSVEGYVKVRRYWVRDGGAIYYWYDRA